MGYRSDVTALVYPAEEQNASNDDIRTKYEALKMLLPTTFPQVAQEFAACMSWLDGSHMLVFKMESVKWYHDYTEVRDFEAMLDKLEELGYAYEFGRIGEDDDDTEIRRSGGNQYLLGVSRSLTY